MPKLTDADAIDEILFGPRKSPEPETAGFDMNDLAVSSEWMSLEHAISDLVERFPGGREAIANWLRCETDEIQTGDNDKYSLTERE